MPKPRRAYLLAAMVTAVGCSSAVAPSPVDGLWGGDHVVLRVNPLGATVEFDCAQGRLAARPAPDGSGRFDVTGTYAIEIGPIPAEDRPPLAARYFGSVDGDTMRLSVTIVDREETFGPFTLTRGVTPILVKCL